MPKKSRKPPKKQTKTFKERLHGFALGLAEEMVTLPRYVRVLITGFFALAVTFATFPVLTQFFRLVSWATGNPEIILEYIFTQNQTTANVLFGLSFGVGGLFYVIGWRLFVGTVGEDPPAQMRVVWYFLAGGGAVLITAVWLLSGVMAGSTPA